MQVGLRIVHRERLLEPERYTIHQKSTSKPKMVGWESFAINVIVGYNVGFDHSFNSTYRYTHRRVGRGKFISPMTMSVTVKGIVNLILCTSCISITM